MPEYTGKVLSKDQYTTLGGYCGCQTIAAVPSSCRANIVPSFGGLGYAPRIQTPQCGSVGNHPTISQAYSCKSTPRYVARSCGC